MWIIFNYPHLAPFLHSHTVWLNFVQTLTLNWTLFWNRNRDFRRFQIFQTEFLGNVYKSMHWKSRIRANFNKNSSGQRRSPDRLPPHPHGAFKAVFTPFINVHPRYPDTLSIYWDLITELICTHCINIRPCYLDAICTAISRQAIMLFKPTLSACSVDNHYSPIK